VFALVALCGGVVLADEKKPDAKKPDAKKPDEKKPDDKKPGLGSPFTFPPAIKLTDDQTAKLLALQKEYAPKLAEVEKKVNAIMTPERKKTAADLRKKLMDDGKKGPELLKAVNEGLKLTADEVAKLTEAGVEAQKLRTEINKKKLDVLTEEQKKQLPQPKPPEKKPEPAKDKKTEK
jgi:hypothetical protein